MEQILCTILKLHLTTLRGINKTRERLLNISTIYEFVFFFANIKHCFLQTTYTQQFSYTTKTKNTSLEKIFRIFVPTFGDKQDNNEDDGSKKTTTTTIRNRRIEKTLTFGLKKFRGGVQKHQNNK